MNITTSLPYRECKTETEKLTWLPFVPGPLFACETKQEPVSMLSWTSTKFSRTCSKKGS